MAELDSILSKYVSHDKDPVGSLQGAAFVVRDRDGRITYSNAFGRLNFESDSPPFTVDSVCWIASMSKLVTAVSAMQLVEKQAIGLDDDVGKIVPQLSNMDILEGFDKEGAPIMRKQKKAITLRHLLTHSSGLGYDTFDQDLVRWSSAVGRSVTSYSHTIEGYTCPLIFEPGDGWAYGVGLDWAGILVETLSGLSLEDYMQQHIFVPLGMSSTTFRVAKRYDLAEKRAVMGFRAAPRGPLTPGKAPLPESPPKDGGGTGLYSTAQDYGKLLEALLKGGNGLLKTESVKELCRPQLPDTTSLMATFDSEYRDGFCCEYPKGQQANYALGGAVNIEDVPEKRRKGSMMWSGLSNPHWWLDIETGLTATLFTQVLPFADSVVIDLYDKLEKAVYKQFAK